MVKSPLPDERHSRLTQPAQAVVAAGVVRIIANQQRSPEQAPDEHANSEREIVAQSTPTSSLPAKPVGSQ